MEGEDPMADLEWWCDGVPIVPPPDPELVDDVANSDGEQG
jgi:hypothetical protein